MDCVCIRDCYIDHEGGFRHYMYGEVHNFKSCPAHFRRMDQWSVDFEGDTYEVLMASKEWTGHEAQEWLLKTYRKDITHDLPMAKRDLVKLIIATRERAIQTLKPLNEV